MYPSVSNSQAANELWLNQGDGTFIAATGGPMEAFAETRVVAWGDADGDGHLDLFVGNEAVSDNELWLNTGDGTGAFTLKTQTSGLASIPYTYAVAWGDFTGDGHLDLVIGTGNGGTDHLWRNDGSGSFTSVYGGPTSNTENTYSVAWGDFTGDGHLDLIACHYGAIRLWVNAGTGTTVAGITTWDFTASTSALTVGRSDVSFYAAAWVDANGDGLLDLFFGGGDSNVANAGVANELWLGDGKGDFVAASAGPVSGSAVTIAAAFADANGDGFMDLYVGNQGGNELWMQGTCSTGVRSPTGGCSTCPTFATEDGGVRCIECPEHSSRDAAGECSICAPGRERSLGSPECSKCELGNFWVEGGECQACPIGEYASGNGTVACKACPSYSTTMSEGSTSITQCSA